MYEQEDIVMITEKNWMGAAPVCTHVLFADHMEYCSHINRPIQDNLDS